MSLNELINRVESGEMMDEDFKHPLALAIKQELTDIEENEYQKKLFNDARILADHIIEKYISLDKEDKLKMAEVYEKEERFKMLGFLRGNRQSLKKTLNDSNIAILFWISNYSKLTHLLEDYVEYTKTREDISIKNSSISGYFSSRDINNNKLKRGTKGTLINCIAPSYFKENKTYCTGKRVSSIFESLTWGINQELKEKILDTSSLLSQRTKIVNICINLSKENKVAESGLAILRQILGCYNLKGKKVKLNSPISLFNYYNYNFKEGRAYKERERNEISLLESITYRMSSDLKEKLQDAVSLLPQRIKIIKNHIKNVNKNEDIFIKRAGITYHLSNYNLKNEKVKGHSSKSLESFYFYDFKNKRHFFEKGAIGKMTPEALTDSLTYRIPQDLKEKLQDAVSLLPQRIKIIKNYLKNFEGNLQISPISSSLIFYLNDYNIKNEKVEPSSEKSLKKYGRFNFKKSRIFQKGEKNEYSLLESLAYRAPADLKERLTSVVYHLPQKIKIITNYLKTKDMSLSYYLKTHTIFNKKVKANSQESSTRYYYRYNLIKNNAFKKGELTINNLINSLTFKVKDKELVERFRKYALQNYKPQGGGGKKVY